MSELISKALLNIINDIGETESTISKVDGAIFVRNNEKIINEKIAYLYNLLQVEAKNYGQKQEEHKEEVELIIAHYKQKLHMVYDEFYCQYVNIQNEIQDARLNQKIAMINFQKVINNGENELKSPSSDIEKLKKQLKYKNDLYENIIEKCNQKFGICKAKFEIQINNTFLIASSLQVINENNIFQKFKNKILNLFTGHKKYSEILSEYHKKVDKIEERQIMEELRNETIDFVTEILELRGFKNDFLEDVG